MPRYSQPMQTDQRLQSISNVLGAIHAIDPPCWRVQYWLQTTKQVGWYADQCAVAKVKPGQHQLDNQHLESGRRYRSANNLVPYRSKDGDVLRLGRWLQAWRRSNISLRPRNDIKSHLRADWDQPRVQRSVTSMGELYLLFSHSSVSTQHCQQNIACQSPAYHTHTELLCWQGLHFQGQEYE